MMSGKIDFDDKLSRALENLPDESRATLQDALVGRLTNMETVASVNEASEPFDRTLDELLTKVRKPLYEHITELEKQLAEEREFLKVAFRILDTELGDSDPIADYTDEEMRSEYPLLWLGSEISLRLYPKKVNDE